MKLLATSDLHNRHDWYAWLHNKAPQYDAVVIAGDLLDMFHGDLYPQVVFLGRWIAQMKATGTHLFLVDGNHDFGGFLTRLNLVPEAGTKPDVLVRDACLRERWMDELAARYGERCAVGWMVKRYPELDNLIVTCLPYDQEAEHDKEKLMKQGSILRRQLTPSPCWIVLHHEPPPGKLGAEGNSSAVLGHLIEDFQPRLVFCGHDHDAPFRSGTCCEQVGLTYVFNPGYRSDGKFPCHVEIDTATMNHRWVR